MRKQKDNQINFLRPNKSKYGYIKYAKLAAVFVIAIAAAAAFFVVHKKNSKVASTSITVPTAYASEIPGWWYQQYFGASVCSTDKCKADADPDKDGLTNGQEYFYHSDPNNTHTVGDEMNDGVLVANNFDPSKKGRITFEVAAEDLSIVSESLLYSDDVKQLINETIDLSKVQVPKIYDQSLNISNDNSAKAFQNYQLATSQIQEKYFTKSSDEFISKAMGSGDQNMIIDLKSRLIKAHHEMLKVKTPSELVMLHKYQISLFEVLPDVIVFPTDEQLKDETSVEGNLWFEKAQAVYALYQKIDLETKRISDKYEK